jgi:hypothetical protein
MLFLVAVRLVVFTRLPTLGGALSLLAQMTL